MIAEGELVKTLSHGDENGFVDAKAINDGNRGSIDRGVAGVLRNELGKAETFFRGKEFRVVDIRNEVRGK